MLTVLRAVHALPHVIFSETSKLRSIIISKVQVTILRWKGVKMTCKYWSAGQWQSHVSTSGCQTAQLQCLTRSWQPLEMLLIQTGLGYRCLSSLCRRAHLSLFKVQGLQLLLWVSALWESKWGAVIWTVVWKSRGRWNCVETLATLNFTTSNSGMCKIPSFHDLFFSVLVLISPNLKSSWWGVIWQGGELLLNFISTSTPELFKITCYYCPYKASVTSKK